MIKRILNKVITIILLCLITLVPIFGASVSKDAIYAADAISYDIRWMTESVANNISISENDHKAVVEILKEDSVQEVKGKLHIEIPGTEYIDVGELNISLATDPKNSVYISFSDNSQFSQHGLSYNSSINTITNTTPINTVKTFDIEFTCNADQNYLGKELPITFKGKIGNVNVNDILYIKEVTDYKVTNLEKKEAKTYNDIKNSFGNKYSSKILNEQDYFIKDYLITSTYDNNYIGSFTTTFTDTELGGEGGILLDILTPYGDSITEGLERENYRVISVDKYDTGFDMNIFVPNSSRKSSTFYSTRSDKSLYRSSSSAPIVQFVIRAAYPKKDNNNKEIENIIKSHSFSDISEKEYDYNDSCKFLYENPSSHTEGDLYSLTKNFSKEQGNLNNFKTFNTPVLFPFSIRFNGDFGSQEKHTIEITDDELALRAGTNNIISLNQHRNAYQFIKRLWSSYDGDSLCNITFKKGEDKVDFSDTQLLSSCIIVKFLYMESNNNEWKEMILDLGDYNTKESHYKLSSGSGELELCLSNDFIEEHNIIKFKIRIENLPEEVSSFSSVIRARIKLLDNSIIENFSDIDQITMYNACGVRVFDENGNISFPSGKWATEQQNAWNVQVSEDFVEMVEESDKDNYLSEKDEYYKYIYRTSDKSEINASSFPHVFFKDGTSTIPEFQIKNGGVDNFDYYYTIEHNMFPSFYFTYDELSSIKNVNDIFNTKTWNKIKSLIEFYQSLQHAEIIDYIPNEYKLYNVNNADFYKWRIAENYNNTKRRAILIDLKETYTEENIKTYILNCHDISSKYINLSPSIILKGNYDTSFFPHINDVYSVCNVAELSVSPEIKTYFDTLESKKPTDFDSSLDIHNEAPEIINYSDLALNDNDSIHEFSISKNSYTINRVSSTAFIKQVSRSDNLKFSNNINLDKYGENENKYIYRLKYQTDTNSQGKGLIFYDSLEDAYEDNMYWEGFYNDIDISQPLMLGVEPVIYYSTKEINPSLNSEDGNLSNTDVWTTTIPNDKKQIKSIAIDCSKDKNGNDFVLKEDNSLFIDIAMTKYVQDKKEISYKAYNQSHIALQTRSGGSSWRTKTVLPSNAVTVGISSPQIRFNVKKEIKNATYEPNTFEFNFAVNIYTDKSINDSNFENGVYKSNPVALSTYNSKGYKNFKIYNGQEQEIKILSNSLFIYDELTIELVEENIEGFKRLEPIRKKINPSFDHLEDIITFNIENEEIKKTGSLKISKEVNGTIKETDNNDNFEFVIKLNPSINDVLSDVEFINGEGKVILKKGETKLIEDIPEGTTYEITEILRTGYIIENTNNDKGEIQSGEVSEASFMNHAVKYGSLKIEKKLSGEVLDPNEEFDFTINLDDKTINGKYGDITFTNGVADIKIKGGNSFIAKDLPITGYTVIEKENEGYKTIKTGDTGNIEADKTVIAEFINEREKGGLEVSKTVTGKKKAIDANDFFKFIITLSSKLNNIYSDVEFKDGVATITLKDGETKTIEGLPAAIKFAIEEQEKADYSLETKTGEEGTIEGNKTKTSKFTNHIEKYGDLEIKKEITGALNESDRNREFKITVTLSDKTIEGKYGDLTFDKGVAVVNLKGGETVKATDLPKDITATITEDDYTAFGFATKISGDNTIKANESGSVTVTNTKTTGNIKISKALTGQKKDVDTSKDFKFTIELSNKDINDTFSGVEFKNGIAEVNLKDGEDILIEDLPTGITYKVTEDDYAPDYVIETKTNDSGNIIKDKTAEVAFTNKVEKYGDVKVEKVITGALNDYDKNKAFNITLTLSDKSISGTFGDITFTNGVAKFALKGGESKTAIGLPKNVSYEVTEDNYTNFGFATTVEGNDKIVSNTEKKVTVTNDKTVGHLSISKNLTGWIKDVDRQKEFKYTITLSNKEISGTFGDITFKNGIATTTLKDGETKTAEALPTGITYTVVEDDYTAEKYILEKKVNDKGSILKDKTAEATFTNRVEKYGSLIVKKEVEGALQDEFNNVYSFTVTLSDKTVNGTFGDMTFKDGVATFTLKAEEKAEATQIPSDISYKVVEDDYRGIGFKTEYTRQTGKIPRNNTTTSFVKNIRETGDLNLTKINDGGDKNKTFNFTVRIKDKSFSGTYGDMIFYNGVAKVSIKGGQTVKAFNLPAATQYEIIESDYLNEGYFTNSENATGTINADAVARSTFTNVYRTGTLNIAKTSNGNDYHKDREFTFKVTITKPDGAFTQSTTYGGVRYENDNGKLVATVKVKEGESIQLTDIPDTFLYKVEEVEADRDGYVTVVKNESGTIDNGKTTIVAFTNTRNTYGDLTVSKEGKGDGVLATKTFTIRITLSDKTINGTFGDMEFVNGVAEIKVKAGESKTAKNLPNGINYVIDELNANLYKVSYDNKEGTIKGNSKVSAKVINEKDLPPIEKKVEGKEHHDLPQRGDTFTYTVSTVIPDGANNFRITDTLVDELTFGKNIKANVDGEEVDVKTLAQTLTCELTKEQIDKWSGKRIVVEFDAVIDSDDLSKYLVDEQIKVPNKAEYLINNAIRKDSNTVTITPPVPEPPIEKFVNEVKHYDLADYDEVFTYKIVTKIPEDVLEFEINDELEPVLEFEKEKAIVKINGKEIETNNSFDGQHLKVVFKEETLKSNRNKEVTVEFNAKIKEDADVLKYLNDENIILIPNKASYTINNSFTDKHTKDSDTVTVTPPTTTPEPVKYVNEKEHEDLTSYDEQFEYKVETSIPRGAYSFVLTDNVVEELRIITDTVKVMIDDEVYEEVNVDENNVTITLDKEVLRNNFGKKLVLTFMSEIREDANVLKYLTEDGKILIPNKAQYVVNDNMVKETNTVTVTPPVTKPEIVKYVNEKEHEDLKTRSEVFTYKVNTTIPRGSSLYILSDTLVPELEYISGTCIIGEEEVEIQTDGQKVFVELDEEQLGRLFEKEVELKFDAKIREGESVEKYKNESGKILIPNTAQYDVGDGEPVSSNTVTVTPPDEIPVEIPDEVVDIPTPTETPTQPTETKESPSTGNKSFIPLAIILSAVAAGTIVMLIRRKKED